MSKAVVARATEGMTGPHGDRTRGRDKHVEHDIRRAYAGSAGGSVMNVWLGLSIVRSAAGIFRLLCWAMPSGPKVLRAVVVRVKTRSAVADAALRQLEPLPRVGKRKGGRKFGRG